MDLQKIVEKAVSELRDKRLPMGVFLATHTADSITTALYCTSHGASEELNPFSKYFLESFGCIKGSIMADAIGIPLAFLFAYGGGKLLAMINKPETAKWKLFWEHLFFYAVSAVNTFAAASTIYLLASNVNK